MSDRALVIEVHLAEGRYHGNGPWPPSPWRLFQALVAGACGGRWAGAADPSRDAAFRWMERLPPPTIAAPPARMMAATRYYVPNNSLDAVGGDPALVHKIRVAKRVQPRLLEWSAPLLYVWTFDAGEEEAATMAALAERLHTFGRGVDAAHARGWVLGAAEAGDRLAAHGGGVHRPAGDGAGDIECPDEGSLASLLRRHAQARTQFVEARNGRKVTVEVRRPEKPLFRTVGYGDATRRFLFDLVPMALDRAAPALVAAVRDTAAKRLTDGLPNAAALVERFLVGRGAQAQDKAARVRILPLPSIGHAEADRGIRRVLVLVPPPCPLRADDVAWAFAGAVGDPVIGEVTGELVPATDRGMLAHYGIERSAPAVLWRTVTPAALPVARGPDRSVAEAAAVAAVVRALRQADVAGRPVSIRVQREPFERRGERAERFATADRFPAARLWHVEIAFAEPIDGPLVIGDGRFLGLGLMAPVRPSTPDVAVFDLSVPVPATARADLLRAVRRALMSLARDDNGRVETLFSGHPPQGSAPSRPGHHAHVFLTALGKTVDGPIDRIAVVAPWVADRSHVPVGRREKDRFVNVVGRLRSVRAGALGVLDLRPVTEGDWRLVGPATEWRTATLYRPTSHPRRAADPTQAVAEDLRAECARRGLPLPEVTVTSLFPGPRDGFTAMVRLRFATAVDGPLLLGRDAHAGGGLLFAT
jgi:CRISPR-associated protein Csb2